MICDLAETYGIYDYESYPVRLIATLSAGLRDNSRLKMELADTKVSNELWLLASAVDRLSILAWQNTEAGQKGTGKPEMFVELLMGLEKKSDVESFSTSEEWERERQRILGGI